jgi:antitoxin FitA
MGETPVMGTITIRDVDDALKSSLRLRAAQHGRSMEAEVRAILEAAVASGAPEHGLGTRIHKRFAHLAEFEAGERPDEVRAANFSE